MSSPRSSREDLPVQEKDLEVVIDAETGDVTVTVDRTHSLLAAVRDARRTPPPAPADDDPRHEVFERELRMLLRMTGQDPNQSHDELFVRRDDLLGRIDTADDLKLLFDEMIDSVLSERTVEVCVDTRFGIRLLGAVLSIYRPDIYASGAFEIGQHFYGRAERKLVAEGAITDYELQKVL